MVEPPGDLWGARVFEVHDGIFVAIEIVFVEERSGAMQQARISELHVVADSVSVKARKQRG